MVTVLTDLSGNVRASSIAALTRADPAHVAARLPGELSEVAARVPGPATLLGIGVVMPGPFDIDGMTSVGPTTLPGWGGLDAAARLGEALGRPVAVENDATAAAVGERLHGVARNLKSFCLLYFGAGLGLGIVNEGHPLRGAFGNAGEIGHVIVMPGGKPCSCGNRGCLEGYASFHALKVRLAAKGVACDSMAELEAIHADRNPVLLEWIEDAALHLSPIVGMIERRHGDAFLDQ